MTHTPGPWRVNGEAIVLDAKGNEVATLALGAQIFEGLDNGNLIAAAPELLEALKAVLAQGVIRQCLTPSNRALAEAAIDKAEGRSGQ